MPFSVIHTNDVVEVRRRLLENRDVAVVCIFGDGAVNRGPFLEGLNWASAYALPVLFVCEDNGFASTTRTSAHTAGPGPKARAEALGLTAAEVDGNDIGKMAREKLELPTKVTGGRLRCRWVIRIGLKFVEEFFC